MITLQPWEVEDWELTDRREGINGWTKEKGEREREEDERREGSKTSLAGSRAHIQEERFVHMPERHQTSADLPCRSVSMTTLSPGKLAWQQRGGERSGGSSERREGREGGGEEKKKKKKENVNREEEDGEDESLMQNGCFAVFVFLCNERCGVMISLLLHWH